MKKTGTIKKLDLKTTTVRILSGDDLRSVAGGASECGSCGSCPADSCSACESTICPASGIKVK